MKSRPCSWMCIGLTVLALVPWVCLGAASGAGAAPVLVDEDCAKCHDQEPTQIAANGRAHKTEVSCLTCHEGHRPKVANNIPECSGCHSGKAHYEVEGCKTCHNPHAPLEVRLEGPIKAVCLTCHQPQGQEMEANPSKHAEFPCNECHANKHKATPTCLECHDSHSQAITKDDCRSCHQAHQPLTLQYGDKVPNVQCAACHGEVLAQLTANTTKHHTVNCVSCHAKKHKTIAQCSSCHGTPHRSGLHKKFPLCGECHGTAHNLNNWESPGDQSGPKKTQ